MSYFHHHNTTSLWSSALSVLFFVFLEQNDWAYELFPYNQLRKFTEDALFSLVKSWKNNIINLGFYVIPRIFRELMKCLSKTIISWIYQNCWWYCEFPKSTNLRANSCLRDTTLSRHIDSSIPMNNGCKACARCSICSSEQILPKPFCCFCPIAFIIATVLHSV